MIGFKNSYLHHHRGEIKDDHVKLWQMGGLDELLERGCQQVRGYLVNLDENHSDRHLCDSISNSQR
ncbi:MAG: hypothetical protein KME31_04060 [Tolypothrix carrinoi HA7290-LM1]|nr:hypothetical protein [Tolypothrix carrinoi HA7290-LM1]